MGNRNPRNAIIFCDKRTGSTFLQNALDSHPQISAFDEMFMIRSGLKKRHGKELFRYMKKSKGMNKPGYLDWLFSADESVVFKLIYGQCNYWKLIGVLKKREIPLIHLVRKNSLKKAVSKYTKNKFDTDKLDAPPAQLLEEVKSDKIKVRNYSRILKKYPGPVMTIYYEDMIGKVEGKVNNIKKRGAFNMTSSQITHVSSPIDKQLCKFLGVRYNPLSCNVTKKNSDNVWKYISNKSEVVRLFRENKLGNLVE